jgi:c-di-GMP-related signal transduction protein
VGLFSLLDTISGMPMGDLLESITLAPPLRDALVGRAGPHASPLTLVEAYERGAWSTMKQLARSSGIDAAHVGALYLQSLAWTRGRLRSLAGN